MMEQQECGEMAQLVLPVRRQYLQLIRPCWTQPESSPGSCYDRGSQDAGQSVDEVDIGEADFQEELNIFLEVCLSLDET